MRTENVVLMRQARESLQGKWGMAIGAFVIYILITAAMQAPSFFLPASGILSLIVAGPMAVGFSIFSLSIARKEEETGIELVFEGFKSFFTCFAAYLLMAIFIFLWALLLIIPGVIAALSYSMTYFIIADNPKVDPLEAIKQSKKMMYGYKWKLFCMFLRFLLWALLCILTLGIGFLWLGPYMGVSMARFYDDIKGQVAQ